MIRSLQLRVALFLLLLLGAVWLGLWTIQQNRATQAAARETDTTLQQVAVSLLLGSRHAGTAPANNKADPSNSGLDELILYLRTRNAALPEFELSTLDHRVLTRSPGFPADDSTAVIAGPGFSDAIYGGERWRIFTLTDRSQGLVCRVASPASQRLARDEIFTADFVNPLLWTLPLLAFITWLAVWRGLRPLRRITDELQARDPVDLQPLNVRKRQIPREVQALVSALNQMFARIAQVLVRQRTFVSAAGHELRTPLAGVKAQLQVARRATEVAPKNRALKRIEAAVARLQRMVNQLLTLGRLNADGLDLNMQPLAATDIAERVLADYRDRAQDRRVRLVLDAEPAPSPINGNRELLEAMLGNLVDNALRYAPADTDVVMAVAGHGGDTLEFCVSDHGPGIPEAERERIFEGFYRLPGNNGSSGLGLAIVRAIAQAHGGTVEMAARGGASTTVCVRLPAAQSEKPA